MTINVKRLPLCPDCGTRLNAGRICEECGAVPGQSDLDCQMAIEHMPGAVLFQRPAVPNPSKRFRSDGK